MSNNIIQQRNLPEIAKLQRTKRNKYKDLKQRIQETQYLFK